MSTSKTASEDELGEKWDRCIADTILKTGTGFGLGLAFSLLLFKRRPWPVALGSGFGLGYAMSNCQHDFRRVNSVYLRPTKAPPSGKTEQSTTTQPLAEETTVQAAVDKLEPPAVNAIELKEPSSKTSEQKS